MSEWWPLLAACAACYALKVAGHVAPRRLLERPVVERLAGLMTVGLLSALVVVQTVATDQRLALDARLPALAVAAIALWRRAPFIVVVVLAAATAALLRALNWAS